MGILHWRSHRVAHLACVATLSCASVVVPAATAGAVTLTKTFSPTTIAPGGTTTLTFTLINPPNNTAQGVSFTDIFPSKLRGASAPNFTSTCTGGLVTFLQGPSPPGQTNTVGFGISGTTVPASGVAAAICTISFDVTNVPLQTGTCPDPNLTNAAGNITSLVNVSNAVTSSCVTVTPANIPTISEQALLVLILLLGIAGVIYVRRH
jgi:uncharacterized repeat protein (TIGR01451 family)